MGRPCWTQNSLYDVILQILNSFNYSCFAKIMNRKPKIGNLTNMTELYPFLESKKWYLLFEGFCGHLLVKTINLRGLC